MAYARETEPLEESGNKRPSTIHKSEGEDSIAPAAPPSHKGGLPLEEVVGPVLRYGSLLSTALIILGIAALAWALHIDSQRFSDLSATNSGVSGVLHTPGELLSGLATGDPLAIISLGLLVLIMTPVLRVASTVLYFLWKGDRIYLAITTFVLLVLLVGFAVGATG